MDRLEFDRGLQALWRAVQGANRYVEERKPWAQAKAEKESGEAGALDDTLRVLLEIMRLSSILCRPFMPEKAVEMRAQLGLDPDFSDIRLEEAARPGGNAWTRTGESAVLFPRLEVPEDA
jgi:methionyl-tRNA synthetase